VKTGETPSSLVIALAKFSKEPMFNPGALTLGELSSALKDFGILTVCLTVGWKGRGLIQPGIDLFKKASTFFDRAEIHMTTMEGQMNLLLNNHLKHLKSDEAAPSVSQIENHDASKI